MSGFCVIHEGIEQGDSKGENPPYIAGGDSEESLTNARGVETPWRGM